MASTYSANLKIELLGTGDQAGTWGTTTNTNLGTALEEAIVGRGTATFTADADLTISITNSNASQTARCYALNLVSSVSLTATRNLIVPTATKPYLVLNSTTGGQSITVKTSAGTGITVPNGRECLVYVDGTNVVAAFDYAPALTLGTALGIASGGTGATTAEGARANLGIVAPPDVSNLVQRTGDSMTGALNEAAALTLTSAATTDIGAQNANTINISGTATITSFGTAAAGVIRRLIFTGTPVLTHNATSLILPGGGNITTAAGDVALMLSLGSSNWRCVQYEKSSGAAIAPGVPDGVFLQKLVTQSSTTFTVPAGKTKVRGYAVGRGGSSTSSASGGGGGFAFGDIAVSAGQVVTVTIVDGAAKVTYGGVDMLIANPASGITAGTASINAAVSNGAAYSGGAGRSVAGSGGASSGSPLGVGVSAVSGGGCGIGGAGEGPGGGGVGGAGVFGGGGAGSAASGVSPGIGRLVPLTDPLLAVCLAPGGGLISGTGVGVNGGPGGGGGGGGGHGGFGGGGGSGSDLNGGQPVRGGWGGELGGGGATFSAAPGGSSLAGGGAGTPSGAGGPAAVWLFY